MSYELGGRANADLREENGLQHLINEIIQHRIDHLNGHWRWPQPDPDLQYEGEVVQWSWQHAQCCGLQVMNYSGMTRRCEHFPRLTQEQAARHVYGEPVEVYCSWCSYDLERGKSNVRKMEVFA